MAMSSAFAFLILIASAGLAGASDGASLPSDAGRLYEVNGVKLFAEISGNGPPILFLHGGLNFFDGAFAKQKSYFSAFRTVIGVDQRGHGHSPDNDQPFTYRRMAEDTAALLKKLDLGPVDVVGHSDGGNVALLLAHNHPELVRRLVISGANIRGDYDGVLAYLRFRLMSDEKFAASLPSTAREQYARVSPDGLQHWSAVVSKTKDLWSTRVVLEPAELNAIRIPVLVMAGDHDAISLEQTIEIYRGLPQGQLCILPATGHATMDELPDDFNHLTRAFLEATAVH
jgi:pimeloyl-ACP methyl ester carboxylesterase